MSLNNVKSTLYFFILFRKYIQVRREPPAKYHFQLTGLVIYFILFSLFYNFHYMANSCYDKNCYNTVSLVVAKKRETDIF